MHQIGKEVLASRMPELLSKALEQALSEWPPR
jgi:hypothetical protein